LPFFYKQQVIPCLSSTIYCDNMSPSNHMQWFLFLSRKMHLISPATTDNHLYQLIFLCHPALITSLSRYHT